MPDVAADPREQIRDALTYARESRHHTGCRCFTYRDRNGSPYCSDREALWQTALSKLIDDCLER